MKPVIKITHFLHRLKPLQCHQDIVMRLVFQVTITQSPESERPSLADVSKMIDTRDIYHNRIRLDTVTSDDIVECFETLDSVDIRKLNDWVLVDKSPDSYMYTYTFPMRKVYEISSLMDRISKQKTR